MTRHDARIVITGGTGQVGTALSRHLLDAGYSVVTLSRHPPQSSDPRLRHLRWDARTLPTDDQDDWASEVDGALAVVNLAGRTVDCIKTPDHCDEILRSRVESTRILGEAVRAAPSPPTVWVQMGTAHIVGDPPSLWCDEHSPPGYGLAPHVAQAWEAEFHRACPEGVRKVILRTSFVLSANTGAMKRLRPLARLGLGGTVASGTQGMSWIHDRDLARLFTRAIEDEAMQGVYLSTAPNPVSNRHFMRALRRSLGMPIGLPTPAWAVRFGSKFILRTDPELALYGRYCASTRLKQHGFEFEFPTIEEAFADLYGN
jgi:hypothetical protein